MRKFCAPVILLVLAAAVGRASAADEEAKRQYERATSLYALERYGEAAAAYEKAFELRPDPALLYNAAQAHRLAGNKVRALALYQNYLRVFSSVRNRSEVLGHIEQLKRAIESDRRVASSPPTEPRSVKIETTPEAVPAHAQPITAETTPRPQLTLVASPPPPERRPLVKRAWFWVVVGGGAAVVATAIALGVVLGGAHSDPAITFGTVRGN
jgi:tetratricopeptide (TPR) repeat protein